MVTSEDTMSGGGGVGVSGGTVTVERGMVELAATCLQEDEARSRRAEGISQPDAATRNPSAGWEESAASRPV